MWKSDRLTVLLYERELSKLLYIVLLFNLVFVFHHALLMVKNPIFVTGYGILNVGHVYEYLKDTKN
jgi:hypothetical protein